ncbi:MAG: NRDE family protein [Gammaproteobacteria bacterium]|jgi:uncharacterized protein with NRDE domain|nr:NRDE family protein [Gammaproteobacteria bacterium]
MCLLFIGYRCHQEFPLFVAANRDEFFARETRQARHWGNGVIAGQDGQAGGTWLGIGPNSRFAAITNRRGSPPKDGLRSRGELTANFLSGSMSARDYAQTVALQSQNYAGFNLLVGDSSSLYYLANDNQTAPTQLAPGYYGLSNGVLDEPWPKVSKGKQRFQELASRPSALTTDKLIELMNDREKAPDHELPSTGLSLALERRLSSAFIQNERETSEDILGAQDYGTLCSTALIFSREGERRFHERNYDAQGRPTRSHFFHLTAD